MSLINLICPHCGGNFDLDSERPLQSFWVCPYCGNRSLMQKFDDTIRLRGIIPGRGQSSSTPPAPFSFTSSDHAAQPEIAQTAAAPNPLDEPAAVQPAPAEMSVAPVVSVIYNSEPSDHTIPEPHPEPAPVLHAEPALETWHENAQAPAPERAEEPAPAAQAVQPAEHVRTLMEIIAEASAVVTEPPAEPMQPALAASPDVPQTEAPAVAESHPDSLPPALPDVSRFEHFCKLAADAAANRDLVLFNTYSRQAIDLQPTDPRMYALRAELTEEADGFASSTWTSLGWFLLTPRRKTALVAQHLYNFNTALKYSRKSQQTELINRIAWQLVRQAIDVFTEQGEIRCRKRLFFKAFKGRFTRHDMQQSVLFMEAVRLINHQTCPLGHEALRDAIRCELVKAPPRIQKRLKRL